MHKKQQRIAILTIFPETFSGFVHHLSDLYAENPPDVQIVDIRDFADGCFRAVDDSPYGGGPGLILRCVPIFRAIASLDFKDAYLIATTPSGARFDRDMAQDLSEKAELIIICGHFEGIDARVLHRVDAEISVGDFVLTGGELPAQMICDSVLKMRRDLL